jgi:hypothetical protein
MGVNFPPSTPPNAFTKLSIVKYISATMEAEEMTLDMGGVRVEVNGTAV